MVFFFIEIFIFGICEGNKVAGFIVFSQQLLKGYFRLGQVNVNDCPAGLENMPAWARNRRKAAVKIRRNLQLCFLSIILKFCYYIIFFICLIILEFYLRLIENIRKQSLFSLGLLRIGQIGYRVAPLGEGNNSGPQVVYIKKKSYHPNRWMARVCH